MFYRLRLWFHLLKRFLKKQPPIRLVLVGVALILAAALFVEALTRPDPSPYVAEEIAEIRDRGVLRVAVRTDLPGFAYKDPISGEWSGIEIAAARAVARAIFDGEERLEFIESTSRALSRLNAEEADIVFALLSGANTSYAYTGAYYTDAYALMTLSGSGLTSLSALAGKKVGVVQDIDAPLAELDKPPALNALAAWAKSAGWGDNSYSFVVYASYPELMDGLDARAVDAALMPAALMPKFFDQTKTAISEAVSQISYCAAVRRSESGLAAIATAAIESMRESGELESLRVQYQLPLF